MHRNGKMTTGTVLFLLDAIQIGLTWPLLLLAAQFDLALARDPTEAMHVASFPLCALLMLFAMGLYRRESIIATARSIARLPLVNGLGATAALVLSGLQSLIRVGMPVVGGKSQMVMFGLAVIGFTVCATLSRIVISVLLRKHLMRRRLVIVGAGLRAWELLLLLNREGRNLDDDVILVHQPGMGGIDSRLAITHKDRIRQPKDLDVASLARAFSADLIVVAPDERRGLDLMQLLECRVMGFPVIPYLTFVEKEIRRIDIKRLEVDWIVYSEGFCFNLMDRLCKRAFDLAVSSVMLVLTAPLLLGGMIAIAMERSGPIFYRQQRVTRHGALFWMLKLRTMRPDAEAGGAVWARDKDNRVTKVGRFLRRSRIDELPQLLNILQGSMSFVGPRPERPMFVEELKDKIPLYDKRHLVKSGLTGWAQVNYPYGASVDDARSKLCYDLYYVKHFSIVFDIVILLQTLRVVVWPSGAR